jgi:hypothetical protein
MGHPLPEEGEGGHHDPQRRLDVEPVGSDDLVPVGVEVGSKQLVGTIEEVETHGSNPKQDDEPDPWETVTSDFGSLGDRLKTTYRRVATDRGPTEEEIKGAFATLIGAWDQVAESVSTALRDPETRDHLKKAASSFAAALGTTISGLGDEFKKTTPPVVDDPDDGES